MTEENLEKLVNTIRYTFRGVVLGRKKRKAAYDERGVFDDDGFVIGTVSTLVCPVCKTPAYRKYTFCPCCGNKLK